MHQCRNSQLKAYFSHLNSSLQDISTILNYDERNSKDDPGSKKMLFCWGCKFQERVINATKASISLTFAAAASGELLPPFVVYY